MARPRKDKNQRVLTKPKPRGVPGVAPGRGSIPGGRQPRFIATEAQRETVKYLRACGWTAERIAPVIDVPVKTVEKYFKEELKTGEGTVKGRISASIIQMALAGDKTMMIFYAKTQMGWKDRYSVGFEDDKGGPVNPANMFTVNITG